jgi:hypothetical protein
MQIDLRTRKSVAFLYEGTEAETRRPVGTAFFVSIDETAGRMIYAVTSAHIVDGARRASMELFLRLRGDGGPFDLPVAGAHWFVHPSADVAAMRLVDQVEPAHRTIYFGELADADFIRDKDVDVGVGVFFIGLFATSRKGALALPVTRFGQISLMRDEKLPVDRGDGVIDMVDAYLVEMRSWSGSSGSPAFVHFGMGHGRSYQRTNDPENLGGFLPGFGRLLGLVSAHFNIPASIGEGLGVDFGGGIEELTVASNTGMAVVTPAEYLRELLLRDDVVDDRRRK